MMGFVDGEPLTAKARNQKPSPTAHHTTDPRIDKKQLVSMPELRNV